MNKINLFVTLLVAAVAVGCGSAARTISVKPVIELDGGTEGNDNDEIKFLPKANVVENGAVLANPEVTTSTSPLFFWDEPKPLKGFIEVKAAYFNTRRVNKAVLDNQAKQNRPEYQLLMKPDEKAIAAYLKKNRKKVGITESLYKTWTHDKKYKCNTSLNLKVDTTRSTLRESFNNALAVVYEDDFTPVIQSFPVFKTHKKKIELEFDWVVPHPTMPDVPLIKKKLVVQYELSLLIKKSLVGKNVLQVTVKCKVTYKNSEGRFVPIKGNKDYILPESVSDMMDKIYTYFEATNGGMGNNNE